MTLILSVLTKEAVYQISDRRLTRQLDEKKIEILEREANKAVIAEKRWAFGYTGIAKVGDEPTDKWLARTILECQSHNMATIAEGIRSAASTDFRRFHGIYSLKDRRFAFQAVGWQVDGPSISPGVLTIHNGFDFARKKWRGEAMNSFQTQFHSNTLEFSPHLNVTAVGHSLDRAEWREIYRRLRRVVGRDDTSGLSVMDTLVGLMQWLSGRHTAIGAGGMVVIIPRSGVVSLLTTGYSPVNVQNYWSRYISTYYYSETGEASIYAPHVVGGGVLISNLAIKPFDPSSPS